MTPLFTSWYTSDGRYYFSGVDIIEYKVPLEVPTKHKGERSFSESNAITSILKI